MAYDASLPIAVMIGRFQPFHDGHLALFREALARAGQVLIMVKWLPDPERCPMSAEAVTARIVERLEAEGHSGEYTVMLAGNVTHVVYGRDVGYAVERVSLPPEVEAVRGRDLR